MGIVDDADVNAISDMLKQFEDAFVSRDWDRFASFFTADAVWMSPDQPTLVGKKAWWSWIGKMWDRSAIEQMDSSHEEIVVAGDGAYKWHNETQIGSGWQRSFKGIFIMH